MSSRPALGSPLPPIQWIPGALSPAIERQGRQDDHSPPYSAEVKKMWIYTWNTKRNLKISVKFTYQKSELSLRYDNSRSFSQEIPRLYVYEISSCTAGSAAH
jgi:hypothetical protein